MVNNNNHLFHLKLCVSWEVVLPHFHAVDMFQDFPYSNTVTMASVDLSLLFENRSLVSKISFFLSPSKFSYVFKNILCRIQGSLFCWPRSPFGFLLFLPLYIHFPHPASPPPTWLTQVPCYPISSLCFSEFTPSLATASPSSKRLHRLRAQFQCHGLSSAHWVLSAPHPVLSYYFCTFLLA